MSDHPADQQREDLLRMCIRLWATLEAAVGGPELPFPTPSRPVSPDVKNTLREAKELLDGITKRPE